MLSKQDIFGYEPAQQYSTAVAYFSMEFAVDQALKIYSGGLGFLAGSHLRSAYEKKQNLMGIGILWKYGYYDQVKDKDAAMTPSFTAKAIRLFTGYRHTFYRSDPRFAGTCKGIPAKAGNFWIRPFISAEHRRP